MPREGEEPLNFIQPRSVNNVINWLVVALAFGVPLYRAWVSLAAVLILVLWFFQGHIRERIARLGHHRLTVAVLVFLALNLISLLWSENPGNGFEYWRKYLYLLLIPAIATSLETAFIRRVFWAFCAGTTISVIMMPIVILGGIHIRHIHPGNPAATMSHLDYSMVLAVAALLILVHLVDSPMDRGRRVLWIVLLGMMLSGLLLNIGRSGQFAFVATLAVLVPFLSRHRSWVFRTAVFSAAAIALVTAFVVVTPFQTRVTKAVVELHDAVVEDRINTNQGKRLAATVVGLEIVRENPVLGTGLGGNMPAFRRLLETDYPRFQDAIGWYPHFHNQYTQVITELGIAGLLALLAIFAALVTGRYQSPEIQSAAVALGCAYLFGFMGDPFLHKQLPLVLFALAAGVISSDDEVFADTNSQSTVNS